MNKNSFVLFFILLSISVFAQAPANDVCSGATAVTPNGTCYGGTTTGAGDHWIGSVGCQSGNHVEVWYSFVATGTSLALNITNGTQGGDIEFILVSATGACSGLALAGSACGASPLTNTLTGLSVGSTYYYTISSTGAAGTFTTCVTNITPPTTPGQDCPTSTILCSKTAFSVGALANGVGAISGNASNENLSALGCLAADERQSQWYKFTVSAAGTMEFIINPNVNADDIDWAVYNITTSGCALTPGGAAAGGATQVTCNFSGCPGNTGVFSGNMCTVLDYDCVGNPGDCSSSQVTATIPNLVAGNTYAMVIDNFSTTNGGFAFDFGTSTAEIGANASFSAAVSASPCMVATVARTPFYTGTNMTYLWNFGDGFTSTSGLPGAHTYTATGIYNISLTVTDALGCVDAFSRAVNIGCIVLPIELLNFEGYNNDDYNVLTWSTVTETNNHYFKVEKSTDGVTFNAIGEVNGAGNSLQKVNYSFIDKSPKTGINYYRLTQTDFDKKSEMSNVISIENKPSVGMDFYPNPTTGDLNIVTFGVNNDNAEIRILNLLGELVSYMKVKNNEINTINLESYNTGIYIVELTGGAKMVRSKLIKN